jgi:hypothetical protein
MKVGITATQQGMTIAQQDIFEIALTGALRDGMNEFHHGDCIGGDAQAHDIARRINPEIMTIVVHPPEDPSKRAWRRGDVVLPEKPYLDRNHDIVDQVDRLFAAPRSYKEQPRSGTWATIRYARKIGRYIAIIWPDGTLTVEPERR